LTRISKPVDCLVGYETQNKLILVVDDEENIRELLRESLEDEGYRVNVAKNGQEAIEKVRAINPDTVLMDVKMPLMSGMDAFLKIKEFQPDLPVIFLTAFGSSEVAISAMKSGAYDYLTKPFDIDEVRIKVKRALELRELSSMSGRTRPEDLPFINSDELVGQSPLMQEVYKQIGKVASSDATVLILGESGTGKELVAKAIHNNSHRKDKAFVVVNCAASPKIFLKASCSAMKRDRLPMHLRLISANSNRLPAAHSSSTRLETCRCRCKPNSCEFSRMEVSRGSGDVNTSHPQPGS